MSSFSSDNNNEIDNILPLETSSERQIIVLLDRAALETVKTKKGEFQLLNCDDHVNIMKRNNKDPADYRPDIVHQVIHIIIYYLYLIFNILYLLIIYYIGINGSIR